ncbi:MAG: ABC transporter substrate-binding protein [Bacteroidales bacterium]|nr:ABC transporter substrate-binding protein [Bacteroidales bacterium]
MIVTRLFIFLFFFSGVAGNAFIARSQTLNIGLLIPDRHSTAARHGAALAIREANERGGYHGKTFHLVVKSVEGMWGVGSKQSVSLIFDDKVLAITGSLDGRNAHLAEQVTTKTKVAFVSAWATDMTLSYAFVPWYFRCIPDDKHQALALMRELYKNRRFSNVALIGTDAYDSGEAINTFIKLAESRGVGKPRKFIYKPSDNNLKKIIQSIKNADIEAVVLFTEPAFAAAFTSLYRQNNMSLPLYGTLALLDDPKAHRLEWKYPEPVVTVSSNQWFTKKGIGFQEKFLKVYGYQPGPVAAYAYDAANTIIEAVKKAGTDRDKIIEALSAIHHQGVTGEIYFDEKGNRAEMPDLMILKDGVPCPMKVSQ